MHDSKSRIYSQWNATRLTIQAAFPFSEIPLLGHRWNRSELKVPNHFPLLSSIVFDGFTVENATVQDGVQYINRHLRNCVGPLLWVAVGYTNLLLSIIFLTLPLCNILAPIILWVYPMPIPWRKITPLNITSASMAHFFAHSNHILIVNIPPTSHHLPCICQKYPTRWPRQIAGWSMNPTLSRKPWLATLWGNLAIKGPTWHAYARNIPYLEVQFQRTKWIDFTIAMHLLGVKQTIDVTMTNQC